MALIKCPECYHNMSSSAKICPNCGKDRRNWFGRHKILTILGSLLSIFIILYIIGSIIPSTGKLYHDDGSIRYEGGMEDGFADGEGTEYYRDGKILYQGTYIRGKMDGKGKYYGESLNPEMSANDTANAPPLHFLMYEGDWKDGLKDGNGTEYYKNGDVKYQGQWQKGLYNGKGVYFKEDKDHREIGVYRVHDGEFKGGLCDGQGSETFVDMDDNGKVKTFTGVWSSGLSGKGTIELGGPQEYVDFVIKRTEHDIKLKSGLTESEIAESENEYSED